MAKDKSRVKKRRYTTYFFPNHFAGLRRIADARNTSVSRVLTEALDTYLLEVGAIDEHETMPVRKEDLRKELGKKRTD